jgi:hypothetical protein
MMSQSQPQAELTRKEIKDLRVLVLFTDIYCRANHPGRQLQSVQLEAASDRLNLDRHQYCEDCAAFLAYAIKRRIVCPLDPKPACKHCPVHCYKPDMRDKVREVMRFAGPHLMKRGRVDLLWHYFF